MSIPPESLFPQIRDCGSCTYSRTERADVKVLPPPPPPPPPPWPATTPLAGAPCPQKKPAHSHCGSCSCQSTRLSISCHSKTRRSKTTAKKTHIPQHRQRPRRQH